MLYPPRCSRHEKGQIMRRGDDHRSKLSRTSIFSELVILLATLQLVESQCCSAPEAECLACNAGVSLGAWCSAHPTTVGCTTVAPSTAAPTSSSVCRSCFLQFDALGGCDDFVRGRVNSSLVLPTCLHCSANDLLAHCLATAFPTAAPFRSSQPSQSFAPVTFAPTSRAPFTHAPTTTAPTTLSPSHLPTAMPSLTPTTARPTVEPTHIPTTRPSHSPTAGPTSTPTASPTYAPTVSPTAAPTTAPTLAPTTQAPSATPTEFPSATPTASPSSRPTSVPSSQPTATPSSAPSAAPTARPTGAPTVQPTVAPTANPTLIPTAIPTSMPSSSPSSAPTFSPTHIPTAEPTSVPSPQPTSAPTAIPTITPTRTTSFTTTATSTVTTTATTTVTSAVDATGCRNCPSQMIELCFRAGHLDAPLPGQETAYDIALAVQLAALVNLSLFPDVRSRQIQLLPSTTPDCLTAEFRATLVGSEGENNVQGAISTWANVFGEPRSMEYIQLGLRRLPLPSHETTAVTFSNVNPVTTFVSTSTATPASSTSNKGASISMLLIVILLILLALIVLVLFSAAKRRSHMADLAKITRQLNANPVRDSVVTNSCFTPTCESPVPTGSGSRIPPGGYSAYLRTDSEKPVYLL
eukprot:m.220696 g.220696  ORF g.220696 m.220696 type:complete len:636 (+) comp15602_c0_seq9:226-2133(+)